MHKDPLDSSHVYTTEYDWLGICLQITGFLLEIIANCIIICCCDLCVGLTCFQSCLPNRLCRNLLALLFSFVDVFTIEFVCLYKDHMFEIKIFMLSLQV